VACSLWAHPLHEHGVTLDPPWTVTCSEHSCSGRQGWGGADATAALRDAGDAGAALAARALELEAELAALDHSMLQVPWPSHTITHHTEFLCPCPSGILNPKALTFCRSSQGLN